LLPHILALCVRESQFASLSDGGHYPAARARLDSGYEI
jgi:hypothetical protein